MRQLKRALTLLGCLPIMIACSVTPANQDGTIGRVEPILKINHASGATHDLVELGRYHQGRRQWAEALDAYRSVLKIDSDHLDARNAVGTILALQGKFDAAIAEFDLAAKTAPRSAQAYNNLGYVHVLKKELQQAIAMFEKAVALDPANPRAVNNLADAYRTSGQPDKSSQVLAHAGEFSRTQKSVLQRDATFAARHGRRDKPIMISLIEPKRGSGMQAHAGGVDLVSPNHAAWSSALHSPDALLLKIEAMLRTVPGNAVQWKTVGADGPQIKERSNLALRLRMSRSLPAAAASEAKLVSHQRPVAPGPVNEPVWTFEPDQPAPSPAVKVKS